MLGVLQLAIELIVDHTVMPLMESALHSTELLLETINDIIVCQSLCVVVACVQGQ